MKSKIIRSATVPTSLKTFLEGSVRPLMGRYNLVLLSSPGEELDWMHEEYGVKTIGVPLERHISLFKDFRSLLQLIKVFHEEKPYMVHSMTPKAGLLCMLAAWICRVPRRVHTFTGLVWPTAVGGKRKVLMLTDKLLCACATHIIPEGEGVKRDLQTYITKKPMKVLGYGNVRGVDMAYWSVTDEVRTKSLELRQAFSHGCEKCFNFIFVGRIVGDKGINELVNAFCRLQKHYSELNKSQEVRLVLVGRVEDELDPLLPSTWEIINATPSIINVGPVWGSDILKYYAASDCFVFPSYREGFPNTVLEAGAMGLPSIVTDINGSNEIIEQGKNGVVIPSKDTDALFNAMLNIIEDDEARRAMASNARPMIASRFEQSFVRKCLLEFYDEVMA